LNSLSVFQTEILSRHSISLTWKLERSYNDVWFLHFTNLLGVILL
jgi:hypothetical protein